MLLGNYKSRLDIKGRTVLPSKFRAVLGKKIVLVKGYDKCLYIFTLKKWEDYVYKNVETKSDETKEERNFKSMFYTNSMPLDIDNQGRVNFPADYIKYAGLKEEIVNIGAINRVEIFSVEDFNKRQKDLDLGELIGNLRKNKEAK